MRTLGFNVNEQELQQIILNVDYDNDGVLNFEEYIQLMEQQKTVDEREDDIVQAFCVFDSESNGYIESADLRELLENMHWDISAEELKDLIISSNLQQDQKIDIEEFAWLVDPKGLPSQDKKETMKIFDRNAR
ncbi:neo-calmodulin-like [Porites lutea]